jgi:hypothetical protein
LLGEVRYAVFFQARNWLREQMFVAEPRHGALPDEGELLAAVVKAVTDRGRVSV